MLARGGGWGVPNLPQRDKRPLPPPPACHLLRKLESLKWGFVPSGSQSGPGDFG